MSKNTRLQEAASNSGLGYWSSVCYSVLITPAYFL